MALALYRKYRPRTFAEVIGQEHVTEPLTQALRSGRLHHAYLFSGPRGCGKTSSARILARSLNCEQGPTPEPCGVCGSCRSLATDGSGSIDVIEIDAASHGGVDDARELREKAFFAPAGSRFKIYVIDEAHMVSSAGFNALLKLVEEPPDYVKFIFATTEPEKVLGTIKSRTHHYPFRLIAPAVLRPYLRQLTEAEGIAVEPAVFPLVVRAGGGSARDSLSVLDQLISGAGPEGVTYQRAVTLLGVTDVALIDDMCDAVAAGDGASAYATIDRVAEAGHDARRFAADLLERLRDLIILQQVPDAVAKGLIDGPADQLDAMSAQATRLGPATLSRCADIVHTGLVDMRGTTAPRLLLELITARMLLPGADDSAGALLQRLERMERRLTLSDSEAVRAEAVRPAPEPGASPPPATSPAPGPAGGASGLSAARAAAAAAGRRGAAPETEGADPEAPGRPETATPDAPPAAPLDVSPTAPLAASPDGSPAASPEPSDDDPPWPTDEEYDDVESGEVPGPPAVPAPPDLRPEAAGRPPSRPEPAGVLPDAPADPVDDVAAPGQLSAAAVREVWSEIIAVVGRKSKKIAALASGAIVRDLEDQTLVLTFRFPAHARMVAAAPELISDALYEALGGRWQIRCDVSGEAGGVSPTTGSPPVSDPVRQPGAPTAPSQTPRQARPANPTRARESGPAAPGTSAAPAADDDDWPEPAKPGGVPAQPVRPEASETHPRAEVSAADTGLDAPTAGAIESTGATAAVISTATPSSGVAPTARTRATVGQGGLAAARAAAAAAVEARSRGTTRLAGPASTQTWSDGVPTEEAPEEIDDEQPANGSGYAGFDPGDEPLDDVIDEGVARQSGEQHALQLLHTAFAGSEQIGQHG